MFQIKRSVKNFTRKQYKSKYLFISWRETFLREHSYSYKIAKATSQRYNKNKRKNIYKLANHKIKCDNLEKENIAKKIIDLYEKY